MIIDLSVNFTERRLSKNASLKKWLCIKISLEYLHTPSSILIAICKIYGQV
ncbi:MAG: hypothetical protein LBR79_05350 [Oscillospiraceae bacterium]|nr:hypothetical protein [Oscillospiraceae bacterium]